MPRTARRARLVALALSLAPTVPSALPTPAALVAWTTQLTLLACSRDEPASASTASTTSSASTSSTELPSTAVTTLVGPQDVPSPTAITSSSASPSASASASPTTRTSAVASASASPSGSTVAWSTLAASASASVIVPDAMGAPDLRRKMHDSRYSPVP